MKASGEAVERAVVGAVFASGVYLGEKIRDASPVRTGAMRDSIGVGMGGPKGREVVVEQVAPYTVFVDFQQAHVTRTYYAEAEAAFRVAVETGDRLLASGGGKEQVFSPFPADGVYTPRTPGGLK